MQESLEEVLLLEQGFQRFPYCRSMAIFGQVGFCAREEMTFKGMYSIGIGICW